MWCMQLDPDDIKGVKCWQLSTMMFIMFSHDLLLELHLLLLHLSCSQILVCCWRIDRGVHTGNENIKAVGETSVVMFGVIQYAARVYLTTVANGFPLARPVCRPCFINLLKRSSSAFDCRTYWADLECQTDNEAKKSVNSIEVNCGPLSVTISSTKPKWSNSWVTYEITADDVTVSQLAVSGHLLW